MTGTLAILGLLLPYGTLYDLGLLFGFRHAVRFRFTNLCGTLIPIGLLKTAGTLRCSGLLVTTGTLDGFGLLGITGTLVHFGLFYWSGTL